MSLDVGEKLQRIEEDAGMQSAEPEWELRLAQLIVPGNCIRTNGTREVIYQVSEGEGKFSTLRRFMSEVNVFCEYQINGEQNAARINSSYHHKGQGEGWEAECEFLRRHGR